MHVLFLIAILVAMAAVVLGVFQVGARTELRQRPTTRRRLRLAFSVCVAVPIIVVAVLALAQQQVCEALGGSWRADSESCSDELGGNGNNDPSRWAWEVPDPVRGNLD
jgi:heme/copper-type cytochrome/quinol oxidase subunit 2